MMFACGPEHVYSVSAPRCINILSHPYQSLPARRSDHMHIDLDGLLPPSEGYTYLLTYIDCFTHWPEAIPMPDITAETVAQAVISGCIARFGTPSTISTDRGHQFESKLLTHLVQPLSIKCIHLIAHHPIANGLVERLHRWFKASLKTQSDPTNWTDSVQYPWCYLASILLSTCRHPLHYCRVRVWYHTPPAGQFFSASSSDINPTSYIQRLKSTMQQLHAPPVSSHHHTVHIPDSLTTCTHVLVRHDAIRKPLQRPYDGPYKVLKCTPKHFP